jgi:hypothetical protein
MASIGKRLYPLAALGLALSCDEPRRCATVMVHINGMCVLLVDGSPEPIGGSDAGAPPDGALVSGAIPDGDRSRDQNRSQTSFGSSSCMARKWDSLIAS